jgi:hypothetical protein
VKRRPALFCGFWTTLEGERIRRIYRSEYPSSSACSGCASGMSGLTTKAEQGLRRESRGHSGEGEALSRGGAGSDPALR